MIGYKFCERNIPDDCLLPDLDAEEEIINVRRLKRREEERRKREEKKKEELAKYLKAAGLTVESFKRTPSSHSRAPLTQNMEQGMFIF